MGERGVNGDDQVQLLDDGEGVAEILDRPARSSAATDEQAIDGAARFINELGVPGRLRDAGVARDDLPDVAVHAMDDWSITRVPRPVTSGAVADLLAPLLPQVGAPKSSADEVARARMWSKIDIYAHKARAVDMTVAA